MRKIDCATMLALAATSSFFLSTAAHGQAAATASRALEISAFGGLTGNYTGLGSGRNLDLTAGLDLNFKPVFSLYPSFEVRGQYPVDGGVVDRQKNILGGLKLAKHYGRVQPYVDFLYGRGAIEYESRFLTPDPNFHYIRSTSNVFSGGVGVDLQLSTRILFKADAQLQRYSTPATSDGHLYSKPLTLGLVYRFNTGR